MVVSEPTPGPWTVSRNSDDQQFIRGPDGRHIAEIESDWPEPARANARLIAAAPDLYLALECLLDWAGSQGFFNEAHACPTSQLKRANDALKKVLIPGVK